MKQCILPAALVLVMLAVVESRPQDLQDSISSVLRTLENEQPRRPSRPRIITKYDFINNRDKKSHLELPPEFVVSTGLTVTQKQQKQASPFRRGRSQNLFGSRQAKTNFVNLKEAVAAAPLVTGVRLPDDESDRVVHRNGRFINNVFIPNSEEVPSIASPSKFLPGEFVVSSQIKGNENRRQLARSGRSFLSENEGYDRSAYTFQPSSSHLTPGAVLPAEQDDFIIQQKTYQSCPGCPSFSIPVPVPKSSSFPGQEVSSVAVQQTSLLEKLVALVQPAINSARGLFSSASQEVGTSEFAKRVSAPEEGGSRLPIYASLAAVGLGLATMLGSGALGGGAGGSAARKLDTDIYQSLNSLSNDLLADDLAGAEYDMGDLLCLPRNYCEKLQSKKYLLDQYPNIKMVASWMANKYFEGVDRSEDEVYSECNLRRCIMALLE